MPFVSGSWVMSLAGTSSMMLGRNGDSSPSRLALDLREKAFSLSLPRLMVAVGFSQLLFIRLMKFLSVPGLLSVYITTESWILSNLFLHLLRWSFFFFSCAFVLWGDCVKAVWSALSSLSMFQILSCPGRFRMKAACSGSVAWAPTWRLARALCSHLAGEGVTESHQLDHPDPAVIFIRMHNSTVREGPL